ncbi:MAG: hypothetical protein Q7S41_04440 [Candidatus Limnocylindria bacterium]|nr:hypothetical protein [Candidatus Limnocylindria bacterium]
MTDRTALLRLVLMSAAWAAGSTAAQALQQRAAGTLVGFALAAAVYRLTRDLGRRGGRGRERKYWRGRPVDDRWS